MSQFARNRTPEIQLPGIQDSLNAPGLVVAPPVSRSANDAQSLMAALGLTAGVAGEAASVIAQDRRMAERDAAIRQAALDASNTQARMYDEGQAALNARQDIQQLASDVQSGSVTADQARAIIDQNTAGFSDAYRQKYLESTLPHIASAATNRTEFLQKQSQENLASKAAASVAGSPDPAKIDLAVNEYRQHFPNVSETDAYASIAIPALRTAAIGGDTKAFEAAKSAIGERFPVEVKIQEGRLAESIARTQAESTKAFANTIDGLYLDEKPFSVVRDTIKSYRGKLDNTVVENAMQEVDRREKQALTLASENINKAYIEDQRNKIRSQNVGLVQSGQAYLIDKKEFADLKGTAHSVSESDGLKEAMDAAFATIAQTSKTPQESLDRQIDLATRNGYAVPVWTRAIKAGGMAATESTVTDPKAPLPPAVESGYAMYKELKAKSPALLATMVDDKSRDFYETVSVLEEDPSVGKDTKRAMFEARRIMSMPEGTALNAIVYEDIKRAANDVVQSPTLSLTTDAQNTGDVSRDIERRAKVYVRAGMNAKEAVDRAAKVVGESRVIINGWSQPLNTTTLPPDVKQAVPDFAKKVIGDYVSKHGEEMGISKSNLTMIADPRTGLFILADGATGIPVDPHGDLNSVVFSTKQIIEATRKAQAEKQAAIDLATISKQHVNPARTRAFGNLAQIKMAGDN